MLSVNPSEAFLRRLADLADSSYAEASAAEQAKALRAFLDAREASCAEMCDDADPVPEDGEVARVWKHRVIPMATVRAAAALARCDTQTFLKSAGNDSSFVLVPQEKPPNPKRRQLRARINRINAAVETAMYNEMLTRNDTGAPVPLGGKAGAMGSMTIDATGVGGKERLVLGGNMRDAQRGAAERAQPETLRVVMKDVGLGLDMRLMSLAGGIVGYYLCYSRALPREHCFIGAAVGVVAMLLVDALLLMIRMSREDGQTRARGQPRSADKQGRKPLPKRGSSATSLPAASAAKQLKQD
uniref:Uncharacterized protein n=1 Tax=Neobodo designis TaxID=312471 RepID=A0A7S1MA02_NEODS|mmetsp:Transcript_36851/g.113751  ORF Transcript_36851/g.113751 Transcript_36851/m.113751 type:complete len:299 (+) Transcript_36851:29-925(+)